MVPKLADESPNDGIRRSERLNYSLPHLIKYGKLSDITLTVGKNGLADGGSNVNGKNFTRA